MIDSHTHVVSADTGAYPLSLASGLPAGWVHECPVSALQLLSQLDVAGVDGAVLVQARAAYGYDNSYVADARGRDPYRLVNAAIIDMSAASRRAALRYWSVTRGVLGLRLFNIPPAIAPAGPAWIDEPATADFVRLAAGLGMRVSVCALACDIGAIGRLLAGAPEVVMAIDHCAFIDLAAGARAAEVRALASLAVHDNVRLKVTTTFLQTAADAGLDARDVLEWLCGAFGAQRLMWGSDYPQYHRENYPDIVEFGRYACSRLTPGEQGEFLGGTALRLWPELSRGAAVQWPANKR